MGNFRRELTQAELNDFNAKVPMLAALAELGVFIDGDGDERAGFCPFHRDHTPRFFVSLEQSRWRCSGACDTGGTIVELLMKANRCSFRHAVEMLRESKTSALHGKRPPTLTKIVVAAPAKVERLAEPEEDEALLVEVLKYYEERLRSSAKALEYLAKRGLSAGPLIEHFGLGYADRTLTYRLSGRPIRQRLKGLGIFRASGHEHLWGALVIPIKDEGGKVVNVYGRKIRDDLAVGTNYHLYQNPNRSCLFNVAGLIGQGEAILCESAIDALTLVAQGFGNAVACFGPEAFDEAMLSTFVEHGIRQVTIAFDRDSEGDRGALKVAVLLQSKGISSRRMLLPRGMDINRYACAVEKPADGLGAYLRAARWIDVENPEAGLFAGFAAPLVPPATMSLRDSNAQRLASLDRSFGAAAHVVAAPGIQPQAIEPVIADEKEIECGAAMFRFADRVWRVKWDSQYRRKSRLAQHISVQTKDGRFAETSDLLDARSRRMFVAAGATALGVLDTTLRREIGHLLLHLEETLSGIDPDGGGDGSERRMSGPAQGGQKPYQRHHASSSRRSSSAT